MLFPKVEALNVTDEKLELVNTAAPNGSTATITIQESR